MRFMWHDLRLLATRRKSINLLLDCLPPVKGNLPDNTTTLNLYAACDPRYFNLYAEPLIASVNQNSPDMGLHLHVYNPELKQFNDLAKFKNIFPKVHLTYTWEHTNLSGLEKWQHVVYFQSVRFIRLYMALRHSQTPIVAVDIDSLIRERMQTLADAAEDADMGLFLRPEHRHPGKRILASTVYAAPTKASVQFLEAAARRLAAHISARLQTEFLDQRSLWMAYTAAKSTLKVWHIPQRFSDWTFAEGSPIWHGKGPRKELDTYLRAERLSDH